MASPSSSSSHLAQLRALAQQHLTEIESDKAQEQEQFTQADMEIQRYAKVGSLDRKQLRNYNMTIRPQLGQLQSQQSQGSAQSISDDLPGKKERFRPFSDILHRLQWDETLDIDEYIVGYLERFEGIKEMSAKSWERDFSEEEWIPMHRVRYVKRVKATRGRDESQGPALGVVWDRDRRIDRIFGSGSKSNSEQPEDLLSIEGTSVTGGMNV